MKNDVSFIEYCLQRNAFFNHKKLYKLIAIIYFSIPGCTRVSLLRLIGGVLDTSQHVLMLHGFFRDMDDMIASRIGNGTGNDKSDKLECSVCDNSCNTDKKPCKKSDKQHIAKQIWYFFQLLTFVYFWCIKYFRKTRPVIQKEVKVLVGSNWQKQTFKTS